MIEFKSVSKQYRNNGNQQRKPSLKDITFKLNSDSNLCLLSTNEHELDTFIKLLTGIELPTSGTISRTASISPVLSSAPAFNPNMTGEENIRFLSKLYGIKPSIVLNFVKSFVGINTILKRKTAKIPGSLRRKIAFSSMLALDFDVYLINKEMNAGGDQEFIDKCHSRIREISKVKTLVIVPASTEIAKELTESALVISEGSATYFSDIDDGLSFHKDLTKI